jgi:hypothetical protein
MSKNTVDTTTQKTSTPEERDAEYVKTLMATVGLVASLISFCLFVGARLLMH